MAIKHNFLKKESYIVVNMLTGMLHRITIMIDSELQKKLREKQAKMIKLESKGVSFSRVINETLEDCLKRKK